MSLQNRVTPGNVLVADPTYRGLFMGNRGVLHNRDRQIVRWRAERRWIICRTEFKGRRRSPMTAGLYTELFFLDEATALAAGHRPCAECQRGRFDAFRAALAATEGGSALTAPAIDGRLDDERRDGERQRRHVVAVDSVPVGAMIDVDGVAYLRTDRGFLAWSSIGYEPEPVGVPDEVEMLTPPLSASALRGGFEPTLHASAQ
jgi:hypothetical protein